MWVCKSGLNSHPLGEAFVAASPSPTYSIYLSLSILKLCPQLLRPRSSEWRPTVFHQTVLFCCPSSQSATCGLLVIWLQLGNGIWFDSDAVGQCTKAELSKGPELGISPQRKNRQGAKSGTPMSLIADGRLLRYGSQGSSTLEPVSKRGVSGGG